MAWVTIGNVRGPRGYKGDPGDPLNQAGWDYLKEHFDAMDGHDQRAPKLGGRGVLHAHPDAEGRSTWLETDELDGGPTEYSESLLRHRLGVRRSTGSLIGVTDAAEFYSELVVDEDTLQVPGWVLSRWGARAGWGVGSGLARGDRYINSSGDLVPVFPVTDHMVGWGSSSMEYGGPELAAAFPEVSFINEGKGGEWSSQIAARMGAIPALLTVTGGSIPASGPVVVTSSNMVTNQYLKPFTGTLAGVPGTLSSTASTLTFTRATAGSVVPVSSGTPFIPTVPAEYRQYVGLLWAGKNNLWTAGQASVVVADTRKMFDYFTPFVKRVLVFNHFVHTSQGIGTTLHSQVQEVNSAYKAMYGDLCFDVNGYILSSQIWADTGITPTSTDLAQQADGVKPGGLSLDDGHLNAAAEVAVANKARAYSSALGWY